MKALEVWLNGEKKCVAGTNDDVLNAIIDVMRYPHLHVGGMIERDGISYHVRWLSESLQIGDEVRICLTEIDEVDVPKTEKPSRTQTEKDENVCARLFDVRSKLPSPPQEDKSATIALFEEHMEQQNFVAAMHILAALGEKNAASAPYWRGLSWIAKQLGLHEEAKQYTARENALPPQDETT